jgi:hypothetical protein
VYVALAEGLLQSTKPELKEQLRNGETEKKWRMLDTNVLGTMWKVQGTDVSLKVIRSQRRTVLELYFILTTG